MIALFYSEPYWSVLYWFVAINRCPNIQFEDEQATVNVA